MRWGQTFCLIVALTGIVSLFVLWFAAPRNAAAFHFPWDQGHDTFTPDDDDDDDNPPDNDDGDDDGDPVEVLTGNFFFSRTLHDIRILDDGPELMLLFSYHSQDRYNGPFGHGWHSTLTSMAIEVTDGVERYVIIRQGNGRRKRYRLNPDGTFQNPVGIYHQLLTNGDGTYTLTFKGGQAYHYNAAGQIERIQGVDQSAIVIAYDDTGAIALATSATGRRLIFTKGANGKIATVRDPMVGNYQFTYDDNNDLVSVQDSLGNLVTYAYDSNHNMTSITAPNSAIAVANVYDAQDRVTSQTLAQGRVEFFYDSPTQTRVRDPRRGTTTHMFDEAGNPTTTTYSDGRTTTRERDENLNLITFTTSTSAGATFRYNARGNLVRLTEPDGREFTFTYEGAFDRLRSVTDVGQSTTAMITYDDEQGLITITDALGGSQTFPADALGLLNTGGRALGTVFPFTSRYQLRP